MLLLRGGPSNIIRNEYYDGEGAVISNADNKREGRVTVMGRPAGT
jgi:hypothetical protein